MRSVQPISGNGGRCKLVARNPAFLHREVELYAPARGNRLDPIADNRVKTRRTKSMVVAVSKDRFTGEKQVLIQFPNARVHYAITTVAEMERIRDGFDAILDQIRRPHLEAL